MKRICALLVSLCTAFVLSGCWDRREIGKIAIVMGLALDAGEKKDEIEITAQIANTRAIAAGEKGGTDQKPYINLSSKGKYVFPSIRTSVTKSGARLYMAHNYVVLFGEEAARRGLADYMDFFLREHELRMDMHLLVCRGRSADVLEVETGFQSIPALHISDLIDAQQQMSTGMTVTILDFMNLLAAGRGAPMIPIMEMDTSDGKKELRMSGTAVFDKAKMIGEMDETETRGFLWASDGAKQAVVVAHPSEKASVGIDVTQASGEIRAEVAESGAVTMVIAVKAEGSLGSQRGEGNYTTKEGTQVLLGAFAREIENEIRACLEKSRTLKSDIFGFSDVLYRQKPKLWESMQHEPLYALPVRIEVKTKLDASGRIGRPAQ